MATFANNIGGDEIVVSVTAEDDDGPLLSLSDGASFGSRIDLIITDDFEAQTFFDEVAKAKVEWDKMKAKG